MGPHHVLFFFCSLWILSNESFFIVKSLNGEGAQTLNVYTNLYMAHFLPDLLALSQVIQREEDVCVLADGVVCEAL